MKNVLKKTVGLLMAVMMIGSMLVCSVSAAEVPKSPFVPLHLHRCNYESVADR